MASDSEATADVDIEAEVAGVDQAPSAGTAAASESAAVSKQAVGDDEATEDEEPADEEDDEEEEDADMDYDELKAMPMIGRKGVPSRRWGSSDKWSCLLLCEGARCEPLCSYQLPRPTWGTPIATCCSSISDT